MSIFKTLALISASSINIPTNTAGQVLDAALNICYFMGGIIAVIVIIFAGFRLVTNGGEPESLKKARNMIVYAVVGLIIIISAFTITWFVLGRFQ